MLRGEELFERLTDFAVRCVKLSRALPEETAGRHMAVQVLRSGTSAGANYEEARGAESRPDFIHKLGLVLKELKETRYWLVVIERTDLVKPASRLRGLIEECEELSAIVGKSVLTAKANDKARKRR